MAYIKNQIHLYKEILGYKGLIKAISCSISNKKSMINITRKDIKHPVMLRVPSTDAKAYKQIFIDQEYKFRISHPPKMILDAGANIGLTSIYFANHYPDAKIIAIEPDNDNYALLKINTKNYDNIEILNAAIWNKNETINLTDPGFGDWGFMTQPLNENLQIKRHSVQGITIDHIMNLYGIGFIDILKIDIEGAEKEVFHNPEKWINSVNSLIIELHERKKAGCNRNFYNTTNEFKHEWQQGENIFLSRDSGCIQPYSQT